MFQAASQFVLPYCAWVHKVSPQIICSRAKKFAYTIFKISYYSLTIKKCLKLFHLKREFVVRMQKNSRDRKRLFWQRFRVSVERVLAEVDVNAGRREVTELLSQSVNAVTSGDNVLVSDKSTAATSCANSEMCFLY